MSQTTRTLHYWHIFQFHWRKGVGSKDAKRTALYHVTRMGLAEEQWVASRPPHCATFLPVLFIHASPTKVGEAGWRPFQTHSSDYTPSPPLCLMMERGNFPESCVLTGLYKSEKCVLGTSKISSIVILQFMKLNWGLCIYVLSYREIHAVSN